MNNQFNLLLNVAAGQRATAPRDLYLGIYQQGHGILFDTVVARPKPMANRRGQDEYAVAAGAPAFIYSVDGRMLLKRPGQRARPLPLASSRLVEINADGSSVFSTHRSEGRDLLCRVDALSGEKTAVMRTEREIAGFALLGSGESVLVALNSAEVTELVRVDVSTCRAESAGLLSWRGRPLMASQLAVSADGQLLTFVDATEGDLFVREVRSGQVRQLACPDEEGSPECPRFSPDGSRVLFCQGGQVWVSSSRGGRIVSVYGNCRHQIVQAFPLGSDGALDHFRNFSTMTAPLAVPAGHLRRRAA